MSAYHVLGKAISALKHDQTPNNQSAVMINPSFQEIAVTFPWHQDCSMFRAPKRSLAANQKTTAGCHIYTRACVPAHAGMVKLGFPLIIFFPDWFGVSCRLWRAAEGPQLCVRQGKMRSSGCANFLDFTINHLWGFSLFCKVQMPSTCFTGFASGW